MSVLIKGGEGSADAKIIVSTTTVDRSSIEQLNPIDVLYNSNENNTIPVLEVLSMPTSASSNIDFSSFSSQVYSTCMVANSSSTGNAKVFFDEVNNNLNNNALIIYVSNSFIGKTCFCIGEHRYRYKSSAGIFYFANILGSNLMIMFRYSGQDGGSAPSTSGTLLDIRIASLTSNAVGMEFINNPDSNTVNVIRTALTHNIATQELDDSPELQVDDVALSNKKLLINSVDIKNKYYIGSNTGGVSNAWVFSEDNTATSVNADGTHLGMNDTSKQQLVVIGKSDNDFQSENTVIDYNGIHFGYLGNLRYTSYVDSFVRNTVRAKEVLDTYPPANTNWSANVNVDQNRPVLIIGYPYSDSGALKTSFFSVSFLPSGVVNQFNMYDELHSGQGNYIRLQCSRIGGTISFSTYSTGSMFWTVKLHLYTL